MRPELAGLLIAISFVLTACGPASQESEERLTAEARLPVDGQATYESVCASCHAEGIGGAPLAGDPLAWEGRSPLWMAVLSEHARDGYMQMPAQGEERDLYDAEIQAATEYMMLLAYPARPGD